MHTLRHTYTTKQGRDSRYKHTALSVLLCLALILLAACANPGSGPDGGPYDETPPRIVGITPELGATGNTQRKITIRFDEYINVENAQEKVIVSPPQIEQPEIKVSGKHISVQLLDTLRPATTYTVDFSDAIVDTNEGNALGNFTYYFTTGTTVDTMEVSGHVLSAEDLEPVKGILVGLHANLADTAFTHLPFDRVARTDGNGHFTIKGVAPGSYRIYALKDMDGNFQYSRGEMLAFQTDTITPTSFADIRRDTLWADTVHVDTILTHPYTHYLPDNVVLYAFTETNTTRQLLKTQREPEYFRLYYTAPSTHTPRIEGLNFDAPHSLILDRTEGNDTLTYWLTDTTLFNRDSLVARITYEATNDSTPQAYLQTDTLYLVPRIPYERRQKLQQAETEKWQKALEKRHRRGDYTQEQPPTTPLDIRLNLRGALSPAQNIRLTLKEPARTLDTTAIRLYLRRDSLYDAAPFRLSRDSLSLLNYTLRAEWRPGQEYILNIDSAAISGLSGKANKPRDIKFKIKTEKDYGSLFLIIPDAHPDAVVQLLNTSGKVQTQQPVQNHRADFFYLPPGDVYIRLFDDHNHNLRWDAGQYATGQQAEAVYYYPQKITIRENWDIEQTWNTQSTPRHQQKPRELVKQKETEKKTPRNRNAERERDKRNR